jgi:hypothetical protein
VSLLRLPDMPRGSRHPVLVTGRPEPKKGGRVFPEGGEGMRTYERPTLTKAGSFKKVTGLGGSGPRDVLGRHQLL